MNASVPAPWSGDWANDRTIGSSPPRYVPIVGTNADTIPVNAPRTSALSTRMMKRNTVVAVPHTRASVVRETR